NRVTPARSAGDSGSPARVPVINGGSSVIYAGTPVMLTGFSAEDGSTGLDEPLRAYVADYSDWNIKNARCIAVCETDLQASGGTGTAIVSGVARGFWWRLTHSDPFSPLEGDLICPSSERFVPVQDKYDGPTAKIVRIGNYNSERSGIEVQILLGGGGGGGSGGTFQYSGPWGLWTYMNTINVNPGLIWTPDGAKLVSPGSCNKPSVSSMIVLDYTSGGRLTTVQGDIDQWATNYTNYFNTHALLGRYDAETDSVIQYHFSPIVHLIETEDFVIEPE
ncbi:MAG: hypothetical protein IKS35_02285, partial [Clostridia bacterium]|nr:hypothetical protein [Clostridia bacterium]